MRAPEPPSLHARLRAVSRALTLLHEIARREATFARYSGHLLLAFATIADSSGSPAIRRQARAMARERGRSWQRRWPRTRRRLDADTVMHEVIASCALQRIGIGNERIRRDLQAVLARYTTPQLVHFDAVREGPPGDVPDECASGHVNERGRRVCRTCGARLPMLSRYEVWYYALTNAYFCERHGTPLGVPFAAILARLTDLRPYPKPGSRDHYQSIYAVTHAVYTLNDYGRTRLSPRLLPREFAFLRSNMRWALDEGEPDTIGEIIDSLAAFGAGDTDPLIVRGRRFLIERQREDGGWGDEDDEYRRFHHVWAGIDGLRDYRWNARAVIDPRVRAVLRRVRGSVSPASPRSS